VGRPRKILLVCIWTLKACKPWIDDGTIVQSGDMKELTKYSGDRKAGNCHLNSGDAHKNNKDRSSDGIWCKHFCNLRRAGCRYEMRLVIKTRNDLINNMRKKAKMLSRTTQNEKAHPRKNQINNSSFNLKKRKKKNLGISPKNY